MENIRKNLKKIGLVTLVVGAVLSLSAAGAYALCGGLKEGKTMNAPAYTPYRLLYNSR